MWNMTEIKAQRSFIFLLALSPDYYSLVISPVFATIRFFALFLNNITLFLNGFYCLGVA